MDYNSIGKNIRKRREELGIKQDTFAEMVDISASYMGAIERGEKFPSLSVFIQITNALKISSDFLLSGVLEVHNEIIASELSSQLSMLSKREQKRILHVIETMISDSQS